MKKERATWRTAIAIWWASLWRGGLVCGVFSWSWEFLHRHLHDDNWFMQLTQTTGFRVGAQFLLLVISVWAMREALVDRYKSFELKITERKAPSPDV